MPGIPTTTSTMAGFAGSISSLSALSLPETTLAFWLYVSSPSLQHSLQTVLSTVSVPTKRFTVSSIMTSFAQWQHVLGSIASSGDAEAIAYFENFLLDELNLTPQKIERRRASLRDAMVESLTTLVIEHTSDKMAKGYTKGSCGKYVHPAVKEAKTLLREMAEEDEQAQMDIIRGMTTRETEAYSASMTSIAANSLTFFLDVEEYVLRSEFTAFKKDSVGPNGRGLYDPSLPKPAVPALIRYLRVYHDGLLSVDSKQAYSAPSPTPTKTTRRHSRRLSSTASCQSSNMSYLEKQFLEALQILPQQSASTPALSQMSGNEQRRGSVASTYSVYAQYVEKEKENELRRQRTREIRERKFWDGDWDHEDEFYREALRYDLR